MAPARLGWRGWMAATLATATLGASTWHVARLVRLARFGSDAPFVETEEERERRELSEVYGECFAEPDRVHRLLAVEPYLLQRGR